MPMMWDFPCILSAVCMSIRRDTPEKPLDARARLALFHGTAVSTEKCVQLAESEITFEKIVKSGCTSLNVSAAGIRPLKLKQLGCTDASEMRRLGFDALHLVDTQFCVELVAAFGSKSVIDAFVTQPADAVAVAGTDAVGTLNLAVEQLLEVCAGAPTEAASVLQQTPGPNVLEGVSVTTLLDTGLRAPKLKELGFTLLTVTRLVGSNKNSISKFGFTV